MKYFFFLRFVYLVWSKRAHRGQEFEVGLRSYFEVDILGETRGCGAARDQSVHLVGRDQAAHHPAARDHEPEDPDAHDQAANDQANHDQAVLNKAAHLLIMPATSVWGTTDPFTPC